MEWVLLAAVGAVFLLALVLGLMLLAAYRGGAGLGSARHASGTAGRVGADAAGEPAQPGHTAPEYSDAARRIALAEAASARELAVRESESARRQADVVRREAEQEAAGLIRAARAEISEERARAEADLAELRRALEQRRAEQQAQLTEAQVALEDAKAALNRQRAEHAGAVDELRRRAEGLATDDRRAAEREAALTERGAGLDERDRQLGEQEAEVRVELSRVAGLTEAEARAEVMADVEARARRDAAALARSIENEARAEALDRARAIVVDAVQRVASEQTTESVVSVLHLPGDDMKGRIIGREGRNIRAFESITGVNVIIDDTPEAVLLSCFDPVRREVARIALDKLVLDGRIHPARIEEVYELAKAEVDQLCLRAASDALAEVGVGAVDERLLPVIGRLRYRTSYGQNVLAHLVESAHIAGLMAAELALPRPAAAVVKRAAFLHDIGKALTHEVEGSHALVGADLLRAHGEDEGVVHAVEAHHNEVQPRTVEAVLTQAADACSAARPGARRESLEAYVKRLERIETIAAARPGVERVWAMQAGREVRIMVKPDAVDDLEATVIAREIAKQIEDELTYPGQIRVTVVRETRASEIAH